MTLEIGTRLGPYEVIAPIGAGGMGEVYRARDTKLNRDVAIKILPSEVTQDAERLGRFKREAQLLASLNHPHIASIYGLEESDERPFLVLELVEGEDLSDRLTRGPLPVDEAMELAVQVVEALEEAHEKGVIHRDLKPGNIKLTADDKVKVLDFGLAKALQDERESNDISNSPTLTRARTEAGIILGTAAYMSPEQARGKPVDRRSDIWSFGVVLWEMLTGKELFSGKTFSDVLAGILKESPPFDELPSDVPSSLRRLIQRCLERDIRQRLQWIGDARLELIEAHAELERGPSGATAPVRTSSWKRVLPWAMVLMLAGLSTWLGLRSTKQAPAASKRNPFVWNLSPPVGSFFSTTRGGPAISPDGQKLVFVAKDRDGTRKLWVRFFNDAVVRSLPNTEGGSFPFWSPDSRFIAFGVGDHLNRIDLEGGKPERLATIVKPQGGSWSTNGTILCSRGDGLSLFKILPSGEVSEFSMGERQGQEWYSAPWFLPDGRHFFLGITNLAGERQGIHVVDLETGEANLLVPTVSDAQYTDTGHLLYWQDGILKARSFDIEELKFTGDPVNVADGVVFEAYSSEGFFSVHQELLVYLPGAPTGPSQLTWFDREGSELGVLGEMASYFRPRLSNDGSRLAVDITGPVQPTGDIWIFDTVRGASSRLTSERTNESGPIWSPDGTEVLYLKGPAMYKQSAVGAGDEALVLEGEGRVWPADWFPDGHLLLFNKGRGPGSDSDLWVLDFTSGASSAWATSEQFIVANGAFSPDGKWVAYTSNESGDFEVYVQDFPERREKHPISVGGGRGPRWSRDGTELFYYSPEQGIMSVPVRHSNGLEVGAPTSLFKVALQGVGGEAYFDVAADGRRFIVARLVEQTTENPLVIQSDWNQAIQ